MFIEIFSKDNCIYCEKAKLLLNKKALLFTEYNISENSEYKNELNRRIPGVKTVPQIFVNNESIGGYDSSLKYFLNK